MAGSYREHFFHLVWSTKGRKNYLLPKVQSSLYAYMGGIINKSSALLLDAGGIANHVHLLVKVSNLDRYTAIIRNTKAASSGWLKKEFPECLDFAWQDGYGSFSVSYSQIGNVRKYIQNQEMHHQKKTFEEEYIQFLQLHGVQYDLEHVFD
jgi:putative transposase